MMVDSDKRIRIKIIAGYLFFAILITFAGWWVYANVLHFSTDDTTEYEKMYEKSSITSSVISHLYQVDYNGNRLTQSYSKDALNEYDASLRLLYVSVDSLKAKIVSEHQSELIEKLYELLQEKNKNTLEFAKLRREVGNNDYYSRTLEKVIKDNAGDSLTKTVIVSRVSNDTIRLHTSAKRNFMQRVGDVFSPKKAAQESVQVIASVKTDTLKSKQHPSDSIKIALRKAKEEIFSNRQNMRHTVATNLQKLVTTEQQISTQISLILGELNQEATLNNIQELTARHKTLQDTGKIIAIVAVIAIFVIILFLFFIFKDISSSARYKRELEEARNQAEELMRSRYKMLLNISHDIKAPLCSITGYLDLMEDSIDADVQKWSNSMKISSSYIMDLVTNLLEYARLETGKSVTYISSFDFDLMIKDVLTIFAPIAKLKNIGLSCDTPISVGFISTDAIRIRQIVMNLLSNAVKFTDHGVINIDYLLSPNNTLIIQISDTGRGIDQSKLNTIFDEFTRDEKGGAVEGSGLGLAVVRGTVSLLGGDISVKSELQQGSVFKVTIPVARAESSKSDEPTNIVPLNILLVDDDQLQLRMVSEMMSRSGHTIYCASTLEEANAVVAKHDIKMVLTDMQMGDDFSGHILLQELRKKGYNMPIIVVSASGSENKESLKMAGFNDFLCKPFSLAELNRIVSQSVSTISPEIASLYELMGGDQDAVKEIMDLFIATTLENVLLLKGYLNDDAMSDARRLCHKMLPMFLQLQLTDVAILLKDVDSGDFDFAKIQQIINLTEQVIAQYRTV